MRILVVGATGIWRNVVPAPGQDPSLERVRS
jgi:hypothetical protein